MKAIIGIVFLILAVLGSLAAIDNILTKADSMEASRKAGSIVWSILIPIILAIIGLKLFQSKDES